MNIKTLVTTLLISLTSPTFAGQIYCENFDLATGDVFGNIIMIAPLDGFKKEGFSVYLDHELVSSHFFLAWHEETKSFDFKIYSREFTSESSSFFSIPEKAFEKNFRLGFNSIELTGLGDNVHARCDWTK